MPLTFAIVTPTYNSARYLSETIASIVGQSGEFLIDYHIQDGASDDSTIAIVQSWQRAIAEDRASVLCLGVRLTWASDADAGMYDAVNRGFAAVGTGDLMTWINSDDRLLQGALATVAAIHDEVPEVSWLGGRVSLIDERGCSLGINPSLPYRTAAIARGAHDGRTRPFLMQEGIFWRPSVWQLAGGLDTRFRLAGDWDLWRRFARHADFATVDTVLGVHRRRPGQLSEDMDRYYAEVDAALAAEAGAPRIAERDHDREGAGAAGSIVRYDFGTARWLQSTELADPAPRPPFVVSPILRSQTLPVEVTDGVGAPEGPYPQVYLFDTVRRIEGAVVTGRIVCRRPGGWTSVFECRTWTAGLRLVATIEDQILFDGELPARGHDQNVVVRFPVMLTAGTNMIVIAIHGRRPDGGDDALLVRWTMEPAEGDNDAGARVEASQLDTTLADRGRVGRLQAIATSWPTLTVIVVHQGIATGLEATLNSIVRQSYPGIELVIVSQSASSRAEQLLGRYERAASIVIVPSHRAGGRQAMIEAALAASTGRLVCWLAAGDVLGADALFAATVDDIDDAAPLPAPAGCDTGRTRGRGSGRRRVGPGVVVARSSFAAGVAFGARTRRQEGLDEAKGVNGLPARLATGLRPAFPARHDASLGATTFARHRLGLPSDAYIVLCSAKDAQLLGASNLSPASVSRALALVVRHQNDEELHGAADKTAWPSRVAGPMDDGAVRALYLAAADVVLDLDPNRTLARAASAHGTATVYLGEATAGEAAGGIAVTDAGGAATALRRLHDEPNLRHRLAARGWLRHSQENSTDDIADLPVEGGPAWTAGPDSAVRTADGVNTLHSVGGDPTILVRSPAAGVGVVVADLHLPSSTALATAFVGGRPCDIRAIVSRPSSDASSCVVRVMLDCMLEAGWNAMALTMTGTDGSSWRLGGLTLLPPWPDFGVEHEGAAVEDGEWRPLAGFSFPEGPYPELNLPHTFRWTYGSDIFFRIFARMPGPRTLFVSVRNVLPDQAIAVQLEGELPRHFPLSSHGITERNRIELKADFTAGWTDVRMTPRILSEKDENGRQLGVLVDRIGFAAT